MYEGILVDVAFAEFFLAKVTSRFFLFAAMVVLTHYKWLGRQSFLDDLASLDPELYKGLIYLKHYTGNPEDLSLNFTIVDQGGSCLPRVLGVPVTLVLIPQNRIRNCENGRTRP
jgi:ubiquitin-protein ligase E3 C